MLGPRGVNGFADGFKTCGFLTTGVLPLGVLPPTPAIVAVVPPPAPAAVVDVAAVTFDTGVVLSPVAAATVAAVVGVLTMPVGVTVLPTPATMLGEGVASCFGAGCCGGCCSNNGPGEVMTTGEVCGCCTAATVGAAIT